MAMVLNCKSAWWKCVNSKSDHNRQTETSKGYWRIPIMDLCEKEIDKSQKETLCRLCIRKLMKVQIILLVVVANLQRRIIIEGMMT